MNNMKQTTILAHLSVGILIGLFNAVLSHFQIETIYYYACLQIFGIMFLLAIYHTQKIFYVFVTSIVCAAIASVPVYFWQTPYATGYSFATMLVALLSAYAINAFHIAYYANTKWLDYDGLFHAVWDTFVELVIAGIFTLITWILIYTCASLFSLLHINIGDAVLMIR